MEFQNDNIWIGAEHLTNDSTFVEIAKQEFHHTSIEDTLENAGEYQHNRRDFLKYLGFGISAATLAACEVPLRRAVPYVTKPDSVVPGVANYYASSFVDGGDYNAILVKTREGRPIKIESNTLTGVEGSHARAQASVLSLYDTHRFQQPGKIADGKFTATTWDELDNAVKSKLGGNVRIITSSIISPTAKAVLEEFVTKYPNAKVVPYDAVSYNGMLEANLANFGERVIPGYRFDNASVIVSFDADFLGTWVSPTEFNQQYVKGRRIENHEEAKMSRHIQVESRMSLTGSNADNRILVRPSEQGAAIATLYNEVAALTGGVQISAPRVNETAGKAIKKVAAELVANKGKSLVVAASNVTGEQILVNKTNDLLGSYGTTIDFANANLQRQGSDAAVQAAINEIDGSVAVIVWGCNPVFDLPYGEQVKAAFAKAAISVSFAQKMDETAAACKYVAPANHILESWGDAEARRGQVTLIQPTIAQIFNTRQAELSLLKWADSANVNWGAEQPFYEYLKKNWEKSYFKAGKFLAFQSFWDNTLHDGVFGASSVSAPAGRTCNADVNAAATQVTKPNSAEWEISFYESVNIGDGRYADNPWLQELPDPVMRTVWGNYLSLPLAWNGNKSDFEAHNDLKDGDIVEISANGKTEKAIVVRQFGQMPGTASLALGYGRSVGGAGKGVGTNVYPMMKNSATPYSDVTIGKKVGEDKDFASVQYHHTMGVTGKQEGYKSKENADGTINLDEKALGPGYFKGALTERSVINKSHVSELKKTVGELVEKRTEFDRLNKETLYSGHLETYTAGPHWKMYVDLNSCTGCAACTVACMSENNVPVVGKKEVHRHHEMTWLRIDRYYYGDVTNPNTVYQPMMCQHCDNAPCENVCPVNATNHSHDGLNQMTYNRCIGTRYCANNCPFKVRRFNWLDYTTADLFPYNENYKEDASMLGAGNDGKTPLYADNLIRMVLNPDVTVRSRGVIEKCSFCVQRIQEGKLTAKRDNRTIRDADVKTACQTACPTGAITFGNGNDPESSVSKKIANPMNYLVLEDINVAPNVVYSMKVNNRSDLA